VAAALDAGEHQMVAAIRPTPIIFEQVLQNEQLVSDLVANGWRPNQLPNQIPLGFARRAIALSDRLPPLARASAFRYREYRLLKALTASSYVSSSVGLMGTMFVLRKPHKRNQNSSRQVQETYPLL